MSQKTINKFNTIILLVLMLAMIYTSPVLGLNEAGSGGGGGNYNEINLGAPGNFSKLGEITTGNMLGVAVNIIYVVSTLTFFFILLFGGVKWITSSGDEKKLAAARASITHGLIGLAIVFVAWALMSLLSSLLGFDFTNLTIKSLN